MWQQDNNNGKHTIKQINNATFNHTYRDKVFIMTTIGPKLLGELGYSKDI